MSRSILVRLLLLGAIWGSSFLFMRMTVPALGTATTAAGRLVLGATAVFMLLKLMGRSLEWRARWKDYLVVGLLASGIPFLLFAFAARTLPAGYSAVLNSTVPLFTVLLLWATLHARPSASKLLGVAVGVLGVATLARFGPLELSLATLAGFAACLLASMLYAIAAVQARKRFATTDPLVVAGGSMLAAAFALVPTVILDPPTALPSLLPLLALLTLGLICTGAANLLYFGLLRDAGSERATTVTFLIPVFAQLWAAAFLDEPITAAAVVGCTLVLLAVALVFERIPGPQRWLAGLRRWHAPPVIAPVQRDC